jgi:hypothetical protein
MTNQTSHDKRLELAAEKRGCSTASRSKLGHYQGKAKRKNTRLTARHNKLYFLLAEN